MKSFMLIGFIFLLAGISIHSKQINNPEVADKAENVCPIKIGEKLPSVNLRDANGTEVKLDELTKDQKTVIIFYRGGWCPYCNLHLSELKNVENDLVNLGFKLIAISMDKPEKLEESIKEHALSYELYSDSKADAAKAFGIAFKVEAEYVNKLKSHDMDLEKSSGEQHHILTVPSVFIVDKTGTINFSYVNPNYKVRISGELLLAAARAND